MERENGNRIHRVGSYTAGLSMVGFGILFLLHYFWKNLDYERIFSLWPLILIGHHDLFCHGACRTRGLHKRCDILLLTLPQEYPIVKERIFY